MEGYGEFEVEALGFKVCTSNLLTENVPRAHIIAPARTAEPGEAPICCASGRVCKYDWWFGEDK